MTTCHSVLKNSESLQPAKSLKLSQAHLSIPRAMERLRMPSRQQNPSRRKLRKQAETPTYPCLTGETLLLKVCLAPPAQRMFGRRTRTLLPTTSYLLKPKVQEDVKKKLLKQTSKQAKYYNQNTKELPPLQTGEGIRVAPKPCDRERKWFKARVEDQVDIRSYEVRTEDRRLYRRSRRHLRQSKEPFVQTSETSSVRLSQDHPDTMPAAAEPIRSQLAGQPVQDNFAGQPKQTSQVPPSGPVKPTVVTRSGRVSRAPQYLQDFVTVK